MVEASTPVEPVDVKVDDVNVSPWIEYSPMAILLAWSDSIFCSYHEMVVDCCRSLEGTTFEALAKVKTKSKRKSTVLIQTREDHACDDMSRAEKSMLSR